MSGDAFPRVGWLHKGYHRRQVDSFLIQLEVALGGGLPMPSAAEVRQAGFELVRNGYDVLAVDRSLDGLEERVLTAEQAAGGGRRGRVDPDSEAAFLRDELVAPYMKRFPRARALRRGYDIDDVDDFVDHVIAALDGAERMTVDEVRAAPFRPRRGGYQEDAVDEMLDRVVEHFLVARRREGDARTAQPPGPAA